MTFEMSGYYSGGTTASAEPAELNDPSSSASMAMNPRTAAFPFVGRSVLSRTTTETLMVSSKSGADPTAAPVTALTTGFTEFAGAVVVMGSIVRGLFTGWPRSVPMTRTDAVVARAHARINDLGGLGPNWDSYGGHPPSGAALAEAARFLDAVVDAVGSWAGERVAPHSVTPLPSGGIQLGWRGGSAELELEIDPTGFLSYLFITGKGEGRQFEEADNVGWPEALGLVDRALRS